MKRDETYATVAFGRDEPDMMLIPSPLGAVMITKEGHFLCDDEGNIVGEVDRSYAENWFHSLETQ